MNMQINESTSYFFPGKNVGFRIMMMTVSGLEPPPVIKPPQPAVVAQASTHHSSSYRTAKEPLTAYFQESYQEVGDLFFYLTNLDFNN